MMPIFLNSESKKERQIIGVVMLLSLFPIWRSGGRTGLNFWQFIFNHTIWGPPIEYVPEEDYQQELENSNG
jgi:hypothetical protein